MKKAINKTWHNMHRMPKNANLREKIQWHEEHAKNCNCRDSRSYLLKLKGKVEK